ADAAALLAGGDIDGRADDSYGVDLGGDLELHGRGRRERHSAGAESGSSDYEFGIRPVAGVQFECSARAGHGLRLHPDAADDGDLGSRDGRSGWIDHLTFDSISRGDGN